MKCPLYKRYMNTKKDYLKTCAERQARKKQEQAIWRLVADTIVRMDEPKKQFWIKTLTNIFSQRFYFVPELDWIKFLSGFNDIQAYGKYVNPKYRRYCVLIRDAAVRYINRKEEDIYEVRDQAGNGALCDVR